MLKEDQDEVAARAAAQLHLNDIIPISARTGENIGDELIPAIIETSPEAALALGRELPRYRRQAAQKLVRSASLVALVAGLEPIPLVDIPILLGNQVRMVTRIAALYNEPLSGRPTRELVATVAGGLVFRYIAEEAAKAVPFGGDLVAGAIAAAGTWSLGQVALEYFDGGKSLSQRQMKDMFTRFYRRYREEHLYEQLKVEAAKTDQQKIVNIGREVADRQHLATFYLWSCSMPLGHRPILLLRNGSFYTMSPTQPHAAALAIDRTSGRILAVGDEAEIQAFSGPLTDTLDLGGRAVFPGFIDAHIHLIHHVQSRLGVHLRGAASEEAAVELVRERAAGTPAGTWILGQGWDKNVWAGARFPSKSSLDAVTLQHPVALWDHAGHAMWVNSEALRRANITEETPEPDGGVIAREADGTPTGMLFELGATNLVSAVITAPDESVLAEGLGAVLQELGARGITGVHDIEDDRSLRVLQHLHGAGRLALRVLLYLQKQSLRSAVRLGLQAGFGDDYLRFAGIKLFMDGALGPQTAAMLEPYEHQPDNRGLLTIDDEEVARQVAAATAGGIGIAIHAIGDRAVHTALDGIEATLQTSASGRSSPDDQAIADSPGARAARDARRHPAYGEPRHCSLGTAVPCRSRPGYGRAVLGQTSPARLCL